MKKIVISQRMAKNILAVIGSNDDKLAVEIRDHLCDEVKAIELPREVQRALIFSVLKEELRMEVASQPEEVWELTGRLLECIEFTYNRRRLLADFFQIGEITAEELLKKIEEIL